MHNLLIKSLVTWLDSNLYLLQDVQTRHGIIIDPADITPVQDYIEEADLEIDYILLTHEHYDHIADLNRARQLWPEAKVVSSSACSRRIQSPRDNLSRYFNILWDFEKGIGHKGDRPYHIQPYKAAEADIGFEKELKLDWGGHEILLREAPGHSPGSIFIEIDQNCLFSGDTVSYDDKLITQLPGGSRSDYQEVTVPILQAYDKRIPVYPGHGRSFILEEIAEF